MSILLERYFQCIFLYSINKICAVELTCYLPLEKVLIIYINNNNNNNNNRKQRKQIKLNTVQYGVYNVKHQDIACKMFYCLYRGQLELDVNNRYRNFVMYICIYSIQYTNTFFVTQAQQSVCVFLIADFNLIFFLFYTRKLF